MTNFTNSKHNNSKTLNKRQQASVTYLLPEVIEGINPLFLATIGTVIGVAGLARTGRSEQGFSVKQQDGN